MLLHTDYLTYTDLYDACKAAHVSFVNGVDEKGSRSRVRRFKFRLEGYTSHRYANSGKFGAATWEGNCATWDEWGIFLNVLFQRDPEAHAGKYSYLGLAEFQHQTGNRFDTLAHADQHPNHNWKSGACACGAVRTFDRLENLMLVKHGIVDLGDQQSIRRWLNTPAPVNA